MLLADQTKIHLALGLYNHQPVGNWDYVVEDAYQHSYLPFLDVLERHEAIRFTLHYDGHLLNWLTTHHPEFVQRLKVMVGRGQVELLGGAFYEPMMAMIPPDDQLGQMRRLSDAVRGMVGFDPVGMALAGRVWEPHLVKPIVQAGLRYSVLDDQPFRMVGLRDEDLLGYYQTEELGESLALFPNSRELRALIPFESPERVIEHLRQHATADGSRILVHVDDGAKMGGWPGTYEAVYVQGWLERFFQLLETHRDWVACVTLSDYRERFRPWGRVYLPVGSFAEMQTWSLPPEQAALFEEARSQVPSRYAEFLQGGYWRHFLVRYPESNNMHKKMLRVAARVQALRRVGEPDRVVANASDAGGSTLADPTDDLLARAQEALWRGQSHDAYWHGVFGGIYLNHLRGANYAALIEAEALCDRLVRGPGPFCELEIVDFDCDGATEALVSTRHQNLYFSPAYGGGLFEHDLKSARLNLLDTLARRPESYHPKIAGAVPARDVERLPLAALGERAVVKESGLERFLHYDWYRRMSLLDHFVHPDTQLETFYNVSYGEQGDFINQPYHLHTRELPDAVVLDLVRDGHVWVGSEFWPVRVAKSIQIPRDGDGFTVDYEVTNLWERPVELWFGVEFNLNMRAGAGQGHGYYSATGRHLESSHPAALCEEEHISEIGLRDESLGVDTHLAWNRAGSLWRFPVETVSRSEWGFERVYQSSVLFPNWRLSLSENGQWRCRLVMDIKQQVASP
ncbi:MAG: alpha-amylase/4-alpha-glucanotransferase domain-containing protein [Candidatus Sericytochromatia bacterium]|nr:alpha-amylase/4-alpha-glucanotransferase domain-containing protein [Candidatus Sericytochromatia bacterium]